MSVSQVTCFVHTSKHSHKLALIYIRCYLKGTADKRLIFKPGDALSIKTNVFVDASFACDWGVENNTKPDCVKYGTGYIIEITNCPVLWVSTMQMTITTSTMESEYTVLSQAL